MSSVFIEMNSSNADQDTNSFSSLVTFPFLLIASIAIIGNVLVIIVVIRYKKLKKKSHHYILSLASADMFVGILTLPICALKVSLLL